MILSINSYNRKYVKNWFCNKTRYRSTCFSKKLNSICHSVYYSAKYKIEFRVDTSIADDYIYIKISKCHSSYFINNIIKDILE
jgi:hypothetical protein